MNLSYSSWNRLTKKLRLHPYRVRRVHKISLANKQKRLLMGRHLIQMPQVGRIMGCKFLLLVIGKISWFIGFPCQAAVF